MKHASSVCAGFLLCLFASAAAQWQAAPSMGILQPSTDMMGGAWQPGNAGAADLENYAQCGGIGGACTSASNTCVDTPWPASKCKQGATCVRNTAYHWMCKPATGLASSGGLEGGAAGTGELGAEGTFEDTADTGLIPGTGVTIEKVNIEESPIIARWKQCGGTAGRCKLYGKGACDKDCPFPNTECEPNYVCAKVMNGFWQCAPGNKYEQGVCAEDELEVEGASKDGKIAADDESELDMEMKMDEEMEMDMEIMNMGMEMDAAPAPAPEEEPEMAEADSTGLGSRDADSTESATESAESATESATESTESATESTESTTESASTPAKTPARRVTCGAPAVSSEVDGTYLSGIFLKSETRQLYYQECCSACQLEPACMAFQTNIFQSNAATCDFFSDYKELVPGAPTSISGLMAQQGVTIAG